MKVRDAMHQGATWMPPTTSIGDIAKKMRDEDIGAVPIGENDRLVGIVTDRDITCRGLADGRDFTKLTARDVMSRPLFYCHDDDSLVDALKVMESNSIRRLPVINEKKRLVGMLALGDVSGKASCEQSGEVLRAESAHHS